MSLFCLFPYFLVAVSMVTAKPQMAEERNLYNFQGMVSHATGRDALDFNEYGNWCGKGGGGEAADEVDNCCKVHDHCYDEAKKTCENNGWFSSLFSDVAAYAFDYSWEIEDNVIVCEGKNDQCDMADCQCDKAAAECFARNEYHPENQKFVGKAIAAVL